MGGAGNAVFWGQDPSSWANPALLGYHSGLRAHFSDMPFGYNDVSLESQRFTLASWGLGIALSGKPILGKVRLNNGEQTNTDEAGNELGTFESYEEVKSLGFGLSLGRLAASLEDHIGSPTPLLRLGDVAVGYSRKTLTNMLAPAEVTQDRGGGTGESTIQDYGLLVRLSPINTFDEFTAGLFPDVLQRIGVRLDFAYGYSVQNFGDEKIVYRDADQTDPIPRFPRSGFAGHLALGGRSLFEDTGFETLGRILTPLLSIGAARDTFDETAMIGGERVTYSEVEERGFEITLLNLFSWRTGRYEDPEGLVVGDTSGWSLGLEFDGIGGFRYDKATRPQLTGSEDIDSEAYTFYFDPMAFWRARRSGGAGDPAGAGNPTAP
jgi:hypothetical protein